MATSELGRRELLREAVIESARQFMAANLRAERAKTRGDCFSVADLDREELAQSFEEGARQDLRDVLTAERKVRRGG